MPVKWTPEADQILLLKILETSDITVNVQAIAASWPTNQEAPTPRAVSERLVKIRAMAKENGSASGFTVPAGKKSDVTSPRKKAAKEKETFPKKAGGGVVKKKGTARKRKQVDKVEEESDEDLDESKHEESVEDEPMDDKNSVLSELTDGEKDDV